MNYLLNLVSPKTKRIYAHGIESKLIQLQTKLMGLTLIQREVSWKNYTIEFKKVMKEIIDSNDIKGIIFGDIFIKEFSIQKHKEWGENVCTELGVEAIEPLWNKTPEEIYFEFLEMGFEAIIVSIKIDLINKKWIGRKLDSDFFNYLQKKKLNVCGELGEYHTFVFNGPLFKNKISITKSESHISNGYSFFDILEYL